MSAVAVETEPSRLSFAEYTGDRITKFWNPQSTGSYADDCARGRRFAAELMGYMVENNSPMSLKWILEAMGDLRHGDGTTVGFLHQIAEYAMGGFTSATATEGA